jgi:hypothetical protein
MLEKRQGDFRLQYDSATNAARLMRADILVARYDSTACYVEDSSAWFEAVRSNVAAFFWSHLKRWRALLGYDNSQLGRLHRHVVLNELREWDKAMKHGIWKCSDTSCKWCRGH